MTMTAMDWVTSAGLGLLLVPAVYWDVRERRIPNRLVFPFWLLAPALALALGGVAAAGSSLTALAIGLGLALPFWLLGWLGAGDVKLVAAAAAFVGQSLVFPLLASVAISGAALALLMLLLHGALGRTIERYWASMALSVAARRSTYVAPQGEDANIRLPYAVAIAVGAALVWGAHLGLLALPGLS